MYMTVLPAEYTSATIKHVRAPSSGVQLYEQVDSRHHTKMDAVGRPLPHLSAQQHATGEAVYVDDMPFYRGQWSEWCILMNIIQEIHLTILINAHFNWHATIISKRSNA